MTDVQTRRRLLMLDAYRLAVSPWRRHWCRRRRSSIRVKNALTGLADLGAEPPLLSTVEAVFARRSG